MVNFVCEFGCALAWLGMQIKDNKYIYEFTRFKAFIVGKYIYQTAILWSFGEKAVFMPVTRTRKTLIYTHICNIVLSYIYTHKINRRQILWKEIFKQTPHINCHVKFRCFVRVRQEIRQEAENPHSSFHFSAANASPSQPVFPYNYVWWCELSRLSHQIAEI